MTGAPAAPDRQWRDVAALDELVPGTMTAVNVGRHSILLVRHDGGVSALQNVCPHEHCYLDRGAFEDGAIVCAGHQWRFDAVTGAGIRPRRAKLGRYDTRTENGRVLVALRRAVTAAPS